jgi:hypothetical protein
MWGLSKTKVQVAIFAMGRGIYNGYGARVGSSLKAEKE